jgi:hypothetical protein
VRGSDCNADEKRARGPADLFVDFVVQAVVEVDVRLAVVAALVLLTICLAVGFVYSARSIRKDYEASFVEFSGDSKRTRPRSWTGCSTGIDKVASPTGFDTLCVTEWRHEIPGEVEAA